MRIGGQIGVDKSEDRKRCDDPRLERSSLTPEPIWPSLNRAANPTAIVTRALAAISGGKEPRQRRLRRRSPTPERRRCSKPWLRPFAAFAHDAVPCARALSEDPG